MSEAKLSRRGLLQGLVGAPVAYVLGKGFVAETPSQTRFLVGHVAGRFRVGSEQWESFNVPIMANEPYRNGMTLDIDYLEVTLGAVNSNGDIRLASVTSQGIEDEQLM